MSDKAEFDKKEFNEQKNTVLLYGAAWSALIFLCVPKGSFAIVGSALLLIILIMAYVLRAKTERTSLAGNHTTYIIRSIWTGSFLIPLITMPIALTYLLPNYDPAAMEECGMALNQFILDNGSDPSEMDQATLSGYIAPCMGEFMNDNRAVFFKAGLIAALPILVYFIYRFGKGTGRAVKGHRLANPEKLFF